MASLTCKACGDGFEAKRSNAQFCSDACRKRSRRKSDKQGDLGDLIADAIDGRSAPGAIQKATAAELGDKLDTVLGQIAMKLAGDLDFNVYGSGSHASIAKELRAVMAEAVPVKPAAESTAEQIRSRGATRRNGRTRLRIVS